MLSKSSTRKASRVRRTRSFVRSRLWGLLLNPFLGMVDQTGVVPVRRAEGDADLPDDRMVYRRPSEAREMVDQTGVEPVTS